MIQSPFPGMDPYLEIPDIWQDVHGNVLNVFREQLIPMLLPHYFAKIETEIVIDHESTDTEERQYKYKKLIPDISLFEKEEAKEERAATITISPAPIRVNVPLGIQRRLRTVHIIHHESKELVTVIELISPVNKRPGKGRQLYLDKRNNYFESNIHVIEIDLLYKHSHMPFIGKLPEAPYLIMVSNFYERPAAEIWPLQLQDSLPNIPVPLLQPHSPVPLDLGTAFSTAYQRARYDTVIDYHRLPDLPLSDAEKNWIQTMLNIQ